MPPRHTLTRAGIKPHLLHSCHAHTADCRLRSPPFTFTASARPQDCSPCPPCSVPPAQGCSAQASWGVPSIPPLLNAPSQPLHLAISPSGCPPNSCPPGRKAGPAHPHHHLRTGLWSQQSARPGPAYSCLPPMGQQSPSEAHVTCSPGAQWCLSCLLQQDQWRRLFLGRAIGREGTCGQSGSSGCQPLRSIGAWVRYCYNSLHIYI